MAWYLYRVGRWCFGHKWTVLGVWVALLVLVGIGGSTLSGPTSTNFNLPNTESSKAFDLIKERTPSAHADTATANVVFQAPKGSTLSEPATKAKVEAALALVKTDHVASIADPFATGAISKDGRTGYATITYTKQVLDITDHDRAAIQKAVSKLKAGGLTAAAGGEAAESTAVGGNSSEAIGIVIAFVVLTITFGSLIAAGMPLLTAIIGVGVGNLAILTLTGFIDLSSTTPVLASMLGLAVGIDYALFIMSRYRHEIAIGLEPREAAGIAVGTAGSAVVFAGATVMIALIGLSVLNLSFMTQMGLAAAGTVAVAVIIALTLLPALFALAGTRVTSVKLPFLKARDPEADGPAAGRRWADFVAKLKWPVLVVALAVAAVVAIPVASLQLALPDDGVKPLHTQARQAYDLISKNFGAGANGPLVVVVDTKGAKDPQGAVNKATAAISGIKKDVVAVVPPVTNPKDAKAVATFAAQLKQVQYATITVIPKSGPSAVATKDLVRTMRDKLHALEPSTGATIMVTGQTAVGIDISQVINNAFPRYLIVVVGLAFLLLMLVFRSILVPLKATLGFLVSVGVSLGATVAVFQWGWLQGLIGLDATAPVMFLLPLLLTGILFGLAMDYEVFLVSRMREEHVHGLEAREAVVVGFGHSARVVTAAAVIMTGVFSGFALGDDAIIKSIGFALATGVIADAFLVRMTIVPALMSIVGEKMWWLPKWLDKAMPNVDIEGESLAHRLGGRGSDLVAPTPPA